MARKIRSRERKASLQERFGRLLHREGNRGTPVDTLEIGSVSFPSGEVIACDPLVDLDGARPYIQTIPSGRYPVTICVVPSEKYGDRYACVKVAVSDAKPVRYELGLCGDEELDEIEEDEFFGFCVDAGMGCVADVQTRDVFFEYWKKREAEEEDIDYYNDLFCDLLEENAKTNPKYQSKYGDWLNWTVPGTDLNFQSSNQAGATASIPSTSDTTRTEKSAVSTSTSSTWKRNTKTTAGEDEAEE